MAGPFEGHLGIFDSGVGGLTVVDALLRRHPSERVLYVGDQGHVPYGGRPLEEVQSFAVGISRFLAEQRCRAIVMACNISSAVALHPVAQALAPLPVFGMIGPAAKRSLEIAARSGTADKPLVIGVLATEGTVNSGAYPRAITDLDSNTIVAQVPCTKFVPLVESGQTESSRAAAAAREYLEMLARMDCRTIILGCTHYPYLLPALHEAAAELFSGPVSFIDPSDEAAIAMECAGIFDNAVAPVRGESLLLTTGNTDTFRCQAPRFLPAPRLRTGAASWDAGKLMLNGEY